MPQGNKPIILCETELVDLYHRGVARVLEILGQPGALVTDIAQVFDFFHLVRLMGESERQREARRMQAILERLAEASGVCVFGHSLLWEVARDIEQHERTLTRH